MEVPEQARRPAPPGGADDAPAGAASPAPAAAAPEPGHTLSANVVYATLAASLCSVCLFVLNIVVVWLYGAKVHGSVTLVISATTLAASLCDLGLASKSGVWIIARLWSERSNRLEGMVSAIWTVQLASAAALAGGLALLADVLAPYAGGDATGLRIAATWVLLQAAVRAFTMVSVALERMLDLLIVLPTAEILRLGWTVFCGRSGLGTDWLYWGWAGAYAVSLGLALWRAAVLGRRVGFGLRLARSSLGQSLLILRDGLPFYVNYLGLFSLQVVVQLILGWTSGHGPVSVLYACFALAIISRLLANPVATALFPRITRADAEAGADHMQTSAVLGEVTRLLMLIWTGLYAAFWLAGGRVLAFVGPQYAQALPTLLVLTAAIGLESYAQQLDQVLMAMRRVRQAAWLEGLKYAVLAGLCLALAPAWHELGAAGATLAAMAVSVGTRMILTRRLVPGAGGRQLLAGLALAAAVTGLGLLPHGAWLALPGWLAAAGALRVLRASDLRQAWGHLRQALTGRA